MEKNLSTTKQTEQTKKRCVEDEKNAEDSGVV